MSAAPHSRLIEDINALELTALKELAYRLHVYAYRSDQSGMRADLSSAAMVVTRCTHMFEHLQSLARADEPGIDLRSAAVVLKKLAQTMDHLRARSQDPMLRVRPFRCCAFTGSCRPSAFALLGSAP